MGLASGTIGLLPTYEQIGLLAPILLVLLRMLQGFAVGGEWGGATLMAAEHAPPSRRGLITSISQVGLAAGGLGATGAMMIVSALPRDVMLGWAWRIPFLISFVIFAIGIYVRMKVSESPIYEALEAEEKKARSPISGIFRDHGFVLLRGILIAAPTIIVTTLYGSWAINYAVSAGHSRTIVLMALMVAWAVDIPAMIAYGRLGDRVGRRPIFFVSLTSFIVLAYPAFLAIDSGNVVLLFFTYAVLFVGISTSMTAGLGALLPELFPTKVRNTGVSVAYQGGAVIAGFTPLVASALITLDMGIELISAVIIALCVAALLAVRRTGERVGESLAG
jgi:MFS family permease